MAECRPREKVIRDNPARRLQRLSEDMKHKGRVQAEADADSRLVDGAFPGQPVRGNGAR